MKNHPYPSQANKCASIISKFCPGDVGNYFLIKNALVVYLYSTWKVHACRLFFTNLMATSFVIYLIASTPTTYTESKQTRNIPTISLPINS